MNQIALYYLDNEVNVAKTLPVSQETGTFLSRDLEKFGFGIIPTRRTATSSKQIRLEDVILYVLKSSDSLWSTWFFGFRYQNIITAKRVLRYQKQSICITVYTGSVAFFIIRQILRKCNSVICKRKTVSSDCCARGS